MPRLAFVLVSLSLAVGCSSSSHSADGSAFIDAGQAPDAGPPPPPGPALEDCFVGWTFADCGGEGPPALGCTAARDLCRWFTGGVVAEGYVASPCPATDICCVRDGDGDGWPYDGAFEPTSGAALAGLLQGVGLQPWDVTREVHLGVDVDPALEPEGAPRFSVDDEAYYFGEPMRGQVNSDEYRALFDTFVVGVRQHTFFGYFDLLEVMPSAGALQARVCRFRFTDAFISSCGPSSPLHAEPVCASEGEVRISAVPRSAEELEAMRVSYWARFPDGTETELAF